jgi:hypothetical protein
MSALQTATINTNIINRPCTRCELTLTDPASVEAGIGPICRGFANQILAKEVPSAWSDTDLFNFMMLTPESFPSEDEPRFSAVFQKICASRGMNQGEGQAVKGDDLRDVARELVYLASVAPTNAIYETLIGAIRGIGYKQYAAFVSGDSASGDATVTLEEGNVFLSAVRNRLGQNALYKVGARKSGQRWFVSQSKALDFLPIVSIYWPFAKGINEVLTALENVCKTALEELAPIAQATTEEAPATVPTAPIEVAPAPAPAPAPVVVKSGELAIDHGHHLTHHKIMKETEKAFQIESDDPFDRKVTSWVPKSWLKKTSIEGVYKIIPWALDKLTKYQEAALGIRVL